MNNSVGNLTQKNFLTGFCSNSVYRSSCKQSTERTNLIKVCKILLPQPPEANKKFMSTSNMI